MLLKNRTYQHGGSLRGPPILRRAKRSGGSANQSRRFIGAWKCVCCTTAFFFCRRPAVTFSYLNLNQVYSYFLPITYIGRNALHNMIVKKTYFPIFSHTATAILLIRRLRIGIRIMLRHKDKRKACTICGQLRLLKLTPGTCIRNGPS